MRLQTLKVEGSRFADVSNGLVERVTFRMATGKGGAEGVIPPARLRFEDGRVSHRGKYTAYRMLLTGRPDVQAHRCTIRVPPAVRMTTGAFSAAWINPLSRRRQEWMRYASHAKLRPHRNTCDRS